MSIEDYTIYCTKEQTRIAYELGAPIGITLNAYENGVQLASLGDNKYLWAVTTQQMIGWLREKRLMFCPLYYGDSKYAIRIFVGYTCIYTTNIFPTYEQAELAAIDKALHYLLEKEE